MLLLRGVRRGGARRGVPGCDIAGSLSSSEAAQRRSERTTKLEDGGLTGEADEGGRRPGDLRSEGEGEEGASAACDEVEQRLAVGTNGAEGGYGEAHMTEANAWRRLATGAKVVMGGGVGNAQWRRGR